MSHDAVTAAVRKQLVEHRIVSLPTVTSISQDGNRTEAFVVIKFINIDKPDEFVEVSSFGYGIDKQDKGPGKAMSYAIKYGYLKAFALETGDDPERDNIDHNKYDEPNQDKLDGFLFAISECEDKDEMKAIYIECQEYCKKTNSVDFFKKFKKDVFKRLQPTGTLCRHQGYFFKIFSLKGLQLTGSPGIVTSWHRYNERRT